MRLLLSLPCCAVLRPLRSAADFTLNLIDTPSLLDQDNVSDKVSTQGMRLCRAVCVCCRSSMELVRVREAGAKAGMGQGRTGGRFGGQCFFTQPHMRTPAPTPPPPTATHMHPCPHPHTLSPPSFRLPQRLEDLAEYLSGRKGGEERAVDAVLYLDRLDSHRVGTLDKRVRACWAGGGSGEELGGSA